MREADNHVGDLDASVVDVVLDVDAVSGRAQQADERVAQYRVAQMADVRRLVGIDAGVLDQDLAADICRALAGVVGNFDSGFAGQAPARPHRVAAAH